MRLPVPVSVTAWVRTYVHASNTAVAPLLGQHQLLPLATHVEAGTLGGLIAEHLLSVCILPCPLSTTHGERGHRVTSHLDSTHSTTVYPFSRGTRTRREGGGTCDDSHPQQRLI